MNKDTVAGLAKRIKDLGKLVLTYSGEVKRVESRIETLTDTFTELVIKVSTLERLIVLLASDSGFFTVEENVKKIGLSPDKKIHELLAHLPTVSEILGIEKKEK